jgi:pimeloyl-ACP methyl ester carboxylesterase
MNDAVQYLPRPGGERLAYVRQAGRGPALVWLGGFRSDMNGTKAQALAAWAGARGQAFTRFDYFGHGASSGAFADGTITRWRADALAVIDELTEGPLILIGSSMGGWLACLAAMARPERLAGMVLLAPAADFTEALMKPSLPPEALAALDAQGVWTTTEAFAGDVYPLTSTLLEDGARWSILPGPLPIRRPVRILQGGRDASVPWTHALELANTLEAPDVVFTLIKDGDHRLSRAQDLARLIGAVEELAG